MGVRFLVELAVLRTYYADGRFVPIIHNLGIVVLVVMNLPALFNEIILIQKLAAAFRTTQGAKMHVGRLPELAMLRTNDAYGSPIILPYYF